MVLVVVQAGVLEPGNRERGTGNGERATGNGQRFGRVIENWCMSEMLKGAELAQRFLRFTLNVLWLCRRLPPQPEAQIVRRQLFRSASSAGAQYEEARCAESKADFVHKLKVGAKEMREARYWLRVLHGAGFIGGGSATALIDESDQLSAILNASVTTVRRRT